MKRNQIFLLANLICILFLLQIACKKENPSAVTDSIYGTYSKPSGGQTCGSGSGCWPNLGVVTIKVAPINSTYIKITSNGVIYDSAKLFAGRSFSFDQLLNGYQVYGNGNFGSKTISLEIRDGSSALLHKYDNVPKLYDRY